MTQTNQLFVGSHGLGLTGFCVCNKVAAKLRKLSTILQLKLKLTFPLQKIQKINYKRMLGLLELAGADIRHFSSANQDTFPTTKKKHSKRNLNNFSVKFLMKLNSCKTSKIDADAAIFGECIYQVAYARIAFLLFLSQEISFFCCCLNEYTKTSKSLLGERGFGQKNRERE